MWLGILKQVWQATIMFQQITFFGTTEEAVRFIPFIQLSRTHGDIAIFFHCNLV